MPPRPASSTCSAIAGTSAMNGAATKVFRHMASALTRRPGSSFTNRNPDTIDAQIFSLRTDGSGPGKVSVSSTTTTAKKLNALTASAHA